jgi:hypothetical protein
MEANRLIPGCSTVNFDEITKKRIFEAIDSSKQETKSAMHLPFPASTYSEN